MKTSLASCWYPFRSPEVKAIYENLTPDEASRLKDFSRKPGLSVVILPFLMFLIFFMIYGLFSKALSYPSLLAIAIPIGIISGLIGFSPMRRNAKIILCGSAYAKERGYTPENLPLYAFGRQWQNKPEGGNGVEAPGKSDHD